MRYLTYVASIIVFSVVTAAHASSVLVPSCDGENCSSNLGLMPPSATKDKPAPSNADKPSSTDKPADEAKAPTQEGTILPSTPSAKPSAPKPKNVAITPGGALAKDKAPPPNKNPGKTIAEYQKSFARPPTILSDHDDTLISSKVSREKNLPIALDAAYMWGSNDVRRINEALGYEPKQIPEHCQLRIDTRITSDKGLFSGIVYAGQNSNASYNGAPKSIMFRPRAVCDAPGQLPQTGGILSRVGNKLSVQLGSGFNCAPSEAPPSAITIKYKGDSSVECKYN
jgi:hypothetical protein